MNENAGKKLIPAAILAAMVLGAAAAGGAVATVRLKIASRSSAGQVIRFDLAALGEKPKIHRADLIVRRTQGLHGEDEAFLQDILIYPLGEGRRPAKPGKPLSLRGGWFDRFDATEAVRSRAGGKASRGLLVKQFPHWDVERTRLEVTYEGRPKEVPPQVTALKAFHRSGQTFLTWKEIADPVTSDEPPWAQLQKVIAGLDREREIRYCVYRSPKPINAETLAQAECIARVKGLSCWNVNGRNIEKPIDDLLANQYALYHGQWNPFVSARVDGKYGVDCKMERLVIRDKGQPLPRGTGLYVHTAGEKGKFYYAVVTSVDGVQNTTALSKGNSLSAPLTEATAEPLPVLQKIFPPRPYWNYHETRYHYVRWVGPPYVNLPSQYYNWSVAVPKPLGKSVPLELYLHRDGRSYYVAPYRLQLDSIVVAPHDFPFRSWWYGYHEAVGTLKSFRQGLIHNYTERRLLWFLDWAARNWPVDRGRILVTGMRGSCASGALHLGLRHPDLFNMVLTGRGPHPDYRASIVRLAQVRGGKYVPKVERLWGKVAWDLKTSTGQGGPGSVWDELDCTAAVRRLPATTELPVVTMTDKHVYGPTRDFFLAMLDKGHSVMARFGTWGGGAMMPISTTGNWSRMLQVDVRKDLAMPAFKDPGSEMLYKDSPKGRWTGNLNDGLAWDTHDLLDSPERFEITLRSTARRGRSVAAGVTLRRLQKFKVAGGKTYAWRWKPKAEDRYTKAADGEVTVGADGLVTVPKLSIPGVGGRLIVTPK